MSSRGVVGSSSTRPRSEAPPEGERAKPLHALLRPLSEMSDTWVKSLIWNSNEVRAITLLCLCANNATATVNCKLRKERFNVTWLAAHARMSVSVWHRTLHVLDKQVGGITRIVEPSPEDERINDYTQYVIHPEVFEVWMGKTPADRPAAWDPRRVVRPPPDPIFEQGLETARLAAGLAPGDARVMALRKRSVKADKVAAKLAASGIRLTASSASHIVRAAAHKAEAADLRARFAALGKPGTGVVSNGRGLPLLPAALGADPGPLALRPGVGTGVVSNEMGGALPRLLPAALGADPGPLALRPGVGTGVVSDGRPSPPLADEPDADGFTTEQRRRYDDGVLALLGRYPSLGLLANPVDAALIGVSARRRGRTIEQLGIGLDRLVFKLWRYPERYPAAKAHDDLLRLARGFARRQWPVVHAPLPNVLLQLAAHQPPEVLDERAAAADDESTADESAPEMLDDDAPPTPEELDAMRAHFGLREASAGAAPGDAPARVTTPERDAFQVAIERMRSSAPARFDQWFALVGFVGLAERVLELRAVNAFARDFVERDWQALLVAELRAGGVAVVRVAWSIGPLAGEPIATRFVQRRPG